MERLEPQSEAAIAALISARHSFLARGSVEAAVDEHIHRAWQRCSAYAVDPHHVPRQQPDLTRLHQAQMTARDLLDAAEPSMRLVDDILVAEPHMVILTDANGLCLRLMAPQAQVQADPAGNIFEGASWNERDVGANGLGSAVATREPFVIVGPQHFVDDYLHWTCMGVPLRGAGGELLGVFNLSVQNDRMNRHTWGWTLSLAQAIEAAVANQRPPSLQEELEAVDDPLANLCEALDRFTADVPVPGKRVFAEQARRDLVQAEEQVRGMIQALRQGRIQLEESDRKKDEALASLAHELKTPLAVIFMLLDATELRPDSQSATELTAKLRRQAKRLSRVIKDLADVASMKRGAMTIDVEPVDLNQAVRGAVESALPEAQRKGQRLNVDLYASPLVVNADPGRLEQVVTNLLTNATKYTPSGGSITIESAADGTEAVLRVRDTGHGIAEENLERIFESFTRVIPASGDPGGMGLGLSLVAKLVHLHDGTVRARSGGPGKGSEFEVRLPLPPPGAGLVAGP
jgi:signal transduction histidine kinase